MNDGINGRRFYNRYKGRTIRVMTRDKAITLDKDGEKYVDFDESTNCWGVFGTESGFCYELFSSEKEANDFLNGDT